MRTAGSASGSLLVFFAFCGFSLGQIPETTVVPLAATPSIAPHHVAAAGDRSVWYTSLAYPGTVGLLDSQFHATAFTVPLAAPVGQDIAYPQGIAVAADGSAWFPWVRAKGDGTPLTSFVGHVTAAGAFTSFALPSFDACFTIDCNIALGTDGNMWISEQRIGNIAKVLPSGAVTELPIPTPGSYPGAITAGPDGNVWFTEYSGQKIGRVTPAGQFTEFPLPRTSRIRTGSRWDRTAISGLRSRAPRSERTATGSAG